MTQMLNWFKKIGTVFKESEKITLEVLMDDKVIALLSTEKQEDGPELFTLRYTENFKVGGMASFNLRLAEKPEIGKVYTSEELWHAFARRLPNPKRPDFKDACQKVNLTAGLTAKEHDLELLGKMSPASIANPWRLRIAKSAA